MEGLDFQLAFYGTDPGYKTGTGFCLLGDDQQSRPSDTCIQRGWEDWDRHLSSGLCYMSPEVGFNIATEPRKVTLLTLSRDLSGILGEVKSSYGSNLQWPALSPNRARSCV